MQQKFRTAFDSQDREVKALQTFERSALDRERAEKLISAAATGDAPDAQWFALRTSHRAESDSESALKSAGVTVWLPLRLVEKRNQHTKKLRETLEPLFRSYMFARVVAGPDAWAGLNSVKEVDGVVGVAGNPVPIADKIINKLRQMCEAGEFNDRKSRRILEPGDSVRLTKAGWMTGLEGAVKGYRGKKAERVFVALFDGRPVVDISVANLEKIY